VERPSALKDWAYDTIKEEILDLRLKPGEQLHIDELAERMEISRTPIREALLRLQGDGLVTAVSRVGFFVTEITRRDLEELFEVRALLEGYAVRQAAKLLTEAELRDLDQLIEASREAVEAGDLARFLEKEISLHSLLTERSENRHLVSMMESVQDLTTRERMLSLQSIENVQESLEEHTRIVAALHEGDEKLAGRLMRRHIMAVRGRMLRMPGLNGTRPEAV
jgi:DNA-binding GntR family transcriptional regulator